MRIVLAQREAAEGDVPRFILHDVCVDRGGERIFRHVANSRKGRQREPLDKHLHAEVRHVPSRVAQDLIEQHLERRRDRINDIELFVQQALVDLDMARLIHHLGGGIELRLDIGDLLDDLRGANQRALLAMEELRKIVGLRMTPQVGLFLFGQALPDRRAEDGKILVGQFLGIFRIQIERPIDAVARVPLLLFALLIEAMQGRAAVFIFPFEAALEILGHFPFEVIERKRVAIGSAHRFLLGRGSDILLHRE